MSIEIRQVEGKYRNGLGEPESVLESCRSHKEGASAQSQREKRAIDSKR